MSIIGASVPTANGPLPSSSPEQASLGAFARYADAQRIVDQLSDARFPVEQTQIVGTDLRMVEQVTGRLTWPRALVSGLASGAWFGLFVGVLLSLLADVSLLGALAWGLGWGMLFGVAYAAVTYALTRGRRDFTSLSVTVPGRFEVLVVTGSLERAQAVLSGLSA